MPRRLTPVLLAVLVPAVLILAGCTSAGPSGSASAPATPVPSSASSPLAATATPILTVASASPSATALPPSQSDSAWGRLWNELPPGFPIPPGATPTEIADPVSAAFDVAISVSEAATFMQDALEQANFSTLAMSGPFSDGSIAIDSVGPTTTDCLVQTSMVPMGGLTRLTIRYGAVCPIR